MYSECHLFFVIWIRFSLVPVIVCPCFVFWGCIKETIYLQLFSYCTASKILSVLLFHTGGACHRPCCHYAYKTSHTGEGWISPVVYRCLPVLLTPHRSPCPILLSLARSVWKCLWLYDSKTTGTMLQTRFPQVLNWECLPTFFGDADELAFPSCTDRARSKTLSLCCPVQIVSE